MDVCKWYIAEVLQIYIGHTVQHRVESIKTTTPSSTMTTTNTNSNASSTQQAISSITKINTLSPLASSETHQHHPQHYGSFLYHHHPPSRSSGIGLSFEDNRAPLFLDTGSCSQSNTDCRFVLCSHFLKLVTLSSSIFLSSVPNIYQFCWY